MKTVVLSLAKIVAFWVVVWVVLAVVLFSPVSVVGIGQTSSEASTNVLLMFAVSMLTGMYVPELLKLVGWLAWLRRLWKM
jgi:hypothetical protein